MANGDPQDAAGRLKSLLRVGEPEREDEDDQERDELLPGLVSPKTDSLIRAGEPAAPEPRVTEAEEEPDEGPGPIEGFREFAGRAVTPLAEALRDAPETASQIGGALKTAGSFLATPFRRRMERSQEQGRRLARAEARGEEVPSLPESLFGIDLFTEQGPTAEAIEEEERERGEDILRGVERGVVGRSTALARGALKTGNILTEPVLEVAGAPEPAALEESADFLEESSREALRAIGETETTEGTIAELLSGLGIEFGAFMAGGAGVRSVSARLARASKTPEFIAKGLHKISNPQTFVQRWTEDVLSGGPIDYMIAASGPENASVTFLADLAENEQVRQGLEARGFDPDQVQETLRGIASDRQKRAWFEALVGTAFATPIVAGQAALARGGRRATDPDAVRRLFGAEASQRRQRAAEAEPRGETPAEGRAAEEATEEPGQRAAEGDTGTEEPDVGDEEAAQRAAEVQAADLGDRARDLEAQGRTDEAERLREAAEEVMQRETGTTRGREEGPRFVPVRVEEGYSVRDREQQFTEANIYETPDEAAEAARNLNERAAEEARLAEEPVEEANEAPFRVQQAAFRTSGGEVVTTGAVHDLARVGDEAQRKLLADELAEGEAEAGFVTNRVDEDTGEREFLTREEAQRLTGAERPESSFIAETEAGQNLASRAQAETGQVETEAPSRPEDPEIEEVVQVDASGQQTGRAFRTPDGETFDTVEEAEAALARRNDIERPKAEVRSRLEDRLESHRATQLAVGHARRLQAQPDNVTLLARHARDQALAVTKNARAGNPSTTAFRGSGDDLRMALRRAREQPSLSSAEQEALREAVVAVRMAEDAMGAKYRAPEGSEELESLLSDVEVESLRRTEPDEAPLEERPAEEMTVQQLRDAGRLEEAEAKQAEIEEKLEIAFGDSPSSARAAEDAAETSTEAAGPDAPGRRPEELGERDVGEPVSGVTGRIRRVKNADGSEVTTQYAVVEAREIRASHDAGNFAPRQNYPDFVQERRYHDEPDAQEFVIENARELDPEQVLDPTLRPTDGPPIITVDGVALSGNARSMMVQRAYELHPDAAREYREALVNRAEQYGLDGMEGQIREMDAPVLVRRMVDREIDQSNRETLAELASKFNDQPTRSRDPLGEAQTRARRFLEEGTALEHYSRTIGGSQTLRDYLNSSDGRRFVRLLKEEGTITQQEATRFRRPDGAVSDEGKQALERMLFSAVVDDPEVLARAPRSALRDLTHAVPAMVKAQQVPGWDLGPRVRETLDYLHGFRESDFKDFDEFASQRGLFQEADPKTQRLARFLHEENRSTIKKGFRKYAQDASESRRQDEAGQDMFGNQPVQPDEAFQKRFVEKVYEPQIPGLRGNPEGEEGFIAPDLMNEIARAGTGFVFGSGIGSLFGETPEEKRRNAILYGVGGAAAPKAIEWVARRLSPPSWRLTSSSAEDVTDAIVKGGPTDPNDPHAFHEIKRQVYRRVWRARLPIEEFSEGVARGIQGELPAGQDPSILAAVNAGSTAHADQAFALGVHKPGTTNYRTERGLKAILEEAGARLDDLRFYGMARRIVEDLEPRGLFEEGAEEVDQVGLAIREAAPFGPEKAREILEDFGRTYKEGTAEVLEEGDDQLAAWFQEVQEIDDAWWVLLEEEGVLRQGAAARIRTRNRNYWPFLRDVPQEAGRGGGEAGEGLFTGRMRPRELRGSELPVLDPVESLMIQQYHYSDLIFRHRIWRRLADLAQAEPDNPFMREVPRSQLMERVRFRGEQLDGQIEDEILAELEDETLEAWVPRRVASDEPIIRVEDADGQLRYYELSPEMVDAARSLQADVLPGWVRLMKASARWLRTGVTVMPEFQVANLIRDATFRAATDPSLGAAPGASIGRQVVASPKALAESGEASIRGIARLLAEQLGGDADELIQLWRSAGGPFGAFQDMDRNVLQQRLRQLREADETIDNVTDPLGALRAFGDRIRGTTIAVENGPRLGKFIDEVERAGSADMNTALRAAAESRDVTVDFALRGASSTIRNLAQMSAFWMARMSGLDKMRRAWKANPKKFVGTALGTVTAFSMANYARNRDDPDYWQDIPGYVKNFYWPVKLPDFIGEQVRSDVPDLLAQDEESGVAGTVLKPVVKTEGGVWLRIPKPHELGWLFGSMPVRFVEALDPANPFRNDDIADAVGDIGGELSNMLVEFMPQVTAVTPLIENFFNYDFHLNRPLVNPYEEAQNKAKSLKGRDRATEFARDVGDVMGVAPPKVDNLMNDWFGGAGRVTLETLDVIGRPDHRGQRPEPALGQGFPERFLIGRFVRETDDFSGRSVDEFYEMWENANGAFSSSKELTDQAINRSIREQRGGKTDVDPFQQPEMSRARRIQEKNLELLLKRDVLNNVQQRIALITDQRAAVENDTKLGPEEKRALIRQLNRKLGFLTSLATFKPSARDELFDRWQVPEEYKNLRDRLEAAEAAADSVRQQLREGQE